MRLVQPAEYDNLLYRYQSIWSHLSGNLPEQAPPLYLNESSPDMNAHYDAGNNHFLVTEKLLENLTLDEVDAILYHEVGHQLCGHKFDILNRFDGVTPFRQEFESDSVAVVHGYGDELKSALDKAAALNAESLKDNPLNLRDRVRTWMIDKVDALKSHPTNDARFAEIDRIDAAYCSPPVDECGLEESQDCNDYNSLDDVLLKHQARIADIVSEVQDFTLIDSCGVSMPVLPIQDSVSYDRPR